MDISCKIFFFLFGPWYDIPSKSGFICFPIKSDLRGFVLFCHFQRWVFLFINRPLSTSVFLFMVYIIYWKLILSNVSFKKNLRHVFNSHFIWTLFPRKQKQNIAKKLLPSLIGKFCLRVKVKLFKTTIGLNHLTLIS